MSTFRRYLPWLVLTLGSLYVLSSLRPQAATVEHTRNGLVGRVATLFWTLPPLTPQDSMRLSAFATLPILDHGRVKPIDSFARVELMQMNRRQEYRDPNDVAQPAIRWFLNLSADGLIDSISAIPVPPVVQQYLELEPSRDGLHGVGEVMAAARPKQAAIQAMQQNQARTPRDEAILLTVSQAAKQWSAAKEMRTKLGEVNDPDVQKVFRIDFDQLLEMLRLKRREGLRYSLREITHAADPTNQQAFADFFRKALAAQELPTKKLDTTEHRMLELMRALNVHRALGTLKGVGIVPDKEFSADGWKTLSQAKQTGDAADNPHARHLEAMLFAYTLGNAEAFNAELSEYQKLVNEAMPREAANARLEAWFNHVAPFYRAANLYVIILVFAFLSWITWPREMWLSAVLLLGVTLVLHTAALILRMYIQGRPPVTNLYSSAVFIGWGCTLVCFLMEMMNATRPAVYRNAIPSAVAGLLGFGTMVIAHHLGGSGDTMEVLQAVLDTNFWLATHVTTVTLGYTATFVAGFIAIVFLWWMLATVVYAFFRNRGNPAWSNVWAFIAAANGLVAIPGALVIAILWGGYYQGFGEDPFSAGLAVPIMLPIVVLCGIYATTLIVRYTSEEGAGGQIPASLAWARGLQLDVPTSKAFMNAIYGVTCLALLLSFVGTVLGGIWADQSWGRFWGWDPKENGAILVVIINALLLHARWGGMAKERGTVIIALVGNMVTMWSWFGTNQLGIGLHSYGFNNALIAMCTSFWMCQLVLIGFASLGPQYWKAYAAVPDAKPAKGGKKGKGPDGVTGS